LPSYAAALETGWSPNNITNVSAEQLAAIHADPEIFLAELTRQGGTITLPDGTPVPKLPFISRWMWDGEFCGSISLRWQAGTDELPPFVLGHVGYAVVPWKRGRGHATEALRLTLDEARRVGLGRLQITTDPANQASRRVIERNGGRLVEELVNERYGPEPRLLYFVDLRLPAPRSNTP
jgi:predicted acetyltransferase